VTSGSSDDFDRLLDRTDTQCSSPSPQVKATELDNPLNAAVSDFIQSCRQDFQHDKCKPLISVEPINITEHPSNYEPFE
jgi:hypothetical protein